MKVCMSRSNCILQMAALHVISKNTRLSSFVFFQSDFSNFDFYDSQKRNETGAFDRFWGYRFSKWARKLNKRAANIHVTSEFSPFSFKSWRKLVGESNFSTVEPKFIHLDAVGFISRQRSSGFSKNVYVSGIKYIDKNQLK